MRFLVMIFGLHKLFYENPKIDDIWVIDGKHKDPFTRDIYCVIIEDVKEGWVKYKNAHIDWCSSDSLDVRTFKGIYRKLENTNENPQTSTR